MAQRRFWRGTVRRLLLERATGPRSLAAMVADGRDDEASRILCEVAAAPACAAPWTAAGTRPSDALVRGPGAGRTDTWRPARPGGLGGAGAAGRSARRRGPAWRHPSRQRSRWRRPRLARHRPQGTFRRADIRLRQHPAQSRRRDGVGAGPLRPSGRGAGRRRIASSDGASSTGRWPSPACRRRGIWPTVRWPISTSRLPRLALIR